MLDHLDTVMPFAKILNFRGHQPVVKGVRQTYHCGVKLSQKAMNVLEKQCQRLPGLEKWLVESSPQPHENG
ncbi:MAG: hypothetical protein AAF827_18885 [Cyanobacteria bacterium P01_D01_bin.6]